MPSVYTHFLIARQSFLALPPRIQAKISPHLALYYFGAQGADFCFFYKSFPKKTINFGSYMHRTGAWITFQTLQRYAAQSSALFAYAAGYITHYAADTILHPYVYAAVGKSFLTHTRLEGALDYQYGKAYTQAARKDYKRYFRPVFDKTEKEQLFSLYTEIAHKSNLPPIIKPKFFGAISKFNAYLPLSFAIFIHPRTTLLKQAFGGNYEEKTARLFQSSCACAKKLTREFLQSIELNTPLPKSLFDKSFSTGKSIN